jgi:hypothetical protein
MYRRLAPSWRILTDREPSDLTHVTYTQSRNRTLNTKDILNPLYVDYFQVTLALVPHVNFTNKAPPIIKKITNFSPPFFSQPPLSHSSFTSHPSSSKPSHLQIFLGRVPTSNIISISSTHLHPFTNVPTHHLMCSVRPDCHHGWGARHPFCCSGACEWLQTPVLNFICGGQEQLATPPLSLPPNQQWNIRESRPFKWPWCDQWIYLYCKNIIFTSYSFCVISSFTATNAADGSSMALTAGAPLSRRLGVWILFCRILYSSGVW